MSVVDLLTDPYERRARAVPGLLVALPVLVPILCVYGPRHPALTALAGLLGGCGALYALANIARGRGKKLEAKLISAWGGMPTTIALRHRDSTVLDSVTKQRYHDAIAAKLGIQMPTPEEESADPIRADEAYLAATRQLRELTRGNKGLLLKENTAYGFHRNMLAMKPIGVGVCLIALTLALLLAKVVGLAPFSVAPEKLADPGLPATLTILVSIALLSAWLFYFDADAVKRQGFAYAERLFECLSSVSSTGPRKRRSSRTT